MQNYTKRQHTVQTGKNGQGMGDQWPTGVHLEEHGNNHRIKDDRMEDSINGSRYRHNLRQR